MIGQKLNMAQYHSNEQTLYLSQPYLDFVQSQQPLHTITFNASRDKQPSQNYGNIQYHRNKVNKSQIKMLTIVLFRFIRNKFMSQNQTQCINSALLQQHNNTI